MTSVTPARRLRQLLEGEDLPLLLPGAPNALTARLVEDTGFAACYVSGAGVTNTYLGMPDLGLMTATELADHVAAIFDAVTIPLVVDADTGFGNALNVQRTVRRLERAGAAAIQLEDQVSPKKCGHFDGKQTVTVGEMVGKVQAALDARVDEDVLIIARTDAAAVSGLNEAIDRAGAYAEAGADILFVEAPRTVEQMRRVTAEVPGRHLANMVEGGLTPLLSRAELGDIGYSLALYANSAMRGGVMGMRAVLQSLAQCGDTSAASALMISWADRQDLVRKQKFDALDERYADPKE